MDKKIALFPGSFDPITIGHESIVRRAMPLFDEIIIAIGKNTNKDDFFTLEKRIAWIKKVFHDEPKIKVQSYSGLTVDYCKTVGARYILRGVRTSSDFEYERAIGQMNRSMNDNIETVFLLTQPEHSFITSTIVRDVIRHGGDASVFLPKILKID
jgi:pantetheine-phosphate adenylyltransferase